MGLAIFSDSVVRNKNRKKKKVSSVKHIGYRFALKHDATWCLNDLKVAQVGVQKCQVDRHYLAWWTTYTHPGL